MKRKWFNRNYWLNYSNIFRLELCDCLVNYTPQLEGTGEFALDGSFPTVVCLVQCLTICITKRSGQTDPSTIPCPKQVWVMFWLLTSNMWVIWIIPIETMIDSHQLPDWRGCHWMLSYNTAKPAAMDSFLLIFHSSTARDHCNPVCHCIASK